MSKWCTVSIVSIVTFLRVDTISKVRFMITFPLDFLYFELVLSYNTNQCVM